MGRLRRYVKETFPWLVPARRRMTMARAYVRYYALILWYRVRYRRESVFQTIYRRRVWGRESRSGSGSEHEETAGIVRTIPALLAEFNVRSILDAACGDFFWMAGMRLDIDSYVGVDIVPEMIAENQKKYENERYRFLHRDITRDELPRADLILCRDCFVHLSFEDIFRCLKTFKRSGSTYLLATTYPGMLRKQWNIVTGMWRPLDLELPPFGFPKPLRLIQEGSVDSTDYAKKSLGLWRMEELPA
jgi:hypothetical protein